MKKFNVVVPISPGEIRINRKSTLGKNRRTGKMQIRTSDQYRHAKAIIGEAAHEVWDNAPPMSGPLYVALRFMWPTAIASGPAAHIARGDVDAAVKGTLDALTDAGVYHDDAQIVTLYVQKFHDPQAPRIEISVHSTAER